MAPVSDGAGHNLLSFKKDRTMSLMSWFFPSGKRNAYATAQAGSQQTPARESDSPASASARRKAERAARRELLYTVVREAMVRAGVLSASYKFKVLSLDTEGRQFLIMMDLSESAGGDPGSLSEIEALIAQSAKARHNLLVTAVYWRVNDGVSVGPAEGRQPPRQADSHPMPLDSQPVPLHSAPQPLEVVAATTRGPAYEPIQADEVEAFKRALVAGSRPAPLSATPEAGVARAVDGKAHGPRSFTLLTGYEDTELPETDPKSPVLSGTQHGELR
jgi:hypothetical protein